METLNILIVGDPGSIHTARFALLLQEAGHRVHCFQSELYYSQDEHLRNLPLHVAYLDRPPLNGVTLHVARPFPCTVRDDTSPLARSARILGRAILPAAERAGRRDARRPAELLRLIRRLKPDIVFSLKMQNDGYTVLRASRLPDCPAFRWVHFCWGSDIEFFGKDPAHAPEHAPLIRGLLSRCGFLMADCRRDLRQAVEWGFQGEVLGDFPAFGGFDPDLVGTLQSIPPADRKVILVKGREGGLVGRAFVVLAALQTIPRAHLEGFHIQIVMSSPEVSAVCRYLREFTGLDCHVAPRLPYRELLGLFARSRIAISASDVDGTPSFLVEAMAAGAFPIHSDMESIREWVDPGQNGLVFPVADHRMLAEHIDRALRDDPMVIRAAEINRRTTLTRLNRSDIRERMQSCLSHIMQTPLGIGSRSNS